MEFTQLDPDALAQLEQGTRQSGFYKQVLTDFANSDVTAADVTAQTVTGDRKFETVASGLKRHAGSGDLANVRVIVGEQNGEKHIVLTKS